jgi:hypothetical protein
MPDFHDRRTGVVKGVGVIKKVVSPLMAKRNARLVRKMSKLTGPPDADGLYDFTKEEAAWSQRGLAKAEREERKGNNLRSKRMLGRRYSGPDFEIK